LGKQKAACCRVGIVIKGRANDGRSLEKVALAAFDILDAFSRGTASVGLVAGIRPVALVSLHVFRHLTVKELSRNILPRGSLFSHEFRPAPL
jgi:hypothetical protein